MSYKLHCLTRCVQPLLHGAGSAGNEVLIARVETLVNGQKQAIPTVSGNSLKATTIRNPGAAWLVGKLNLSGKLSAELLYFLYAGGSGGGMGRIDVAFQKRLRTLLPFLSLVGGNTQSGQSVEGRLATSEGILVCRENGRQLRAMLPPDLAEVIPESLIAAESFVGRWQFYKHDAMQAHGEELLPEQAIPEKDPRLPFSGQCLVKGAVFYHEYTLPYGTEDEAAALVHSLSEWHETEPYWGGSKARGFGRVTTRVTLRGPDGKEWDISALRARYEDSCEKNSTEAAAFLAEHWPLTVPGEEGGKRGKGRGKRAAVASDG